MFCSNFCLQLFSIFSFLDTSIPDIPQPCTVRFLVKNYLDINCVPRRSFFEMLLYFAYDELEREKLTDFCSSEGQVQNEPCGEKTCPRGFRPGPTQTRLYDNRIWLEA